MLPDKPCIVAFVTAPDMETARKIAKAALEKKLAACANILPQVESHYWWEGKLEKSAEVMILFKTSVSLQHELGECVRENHPYELPEFVVTTIEGGSREYLAWVRRSVGNR